MRAAIIGLMLSGSISVAFSQQDVLTQSNTSEPVLLKVENTGSYGKTGILVNSEVDNYSVGVEAYGTAVGVAGYIYEPDNTYMPTGVASGVYNTNAYTPRAFNGSVSGGDYSNTFGLNTEAYAGNYSYVYGVYAGAWGGYGSWSAAGYFDGDIHAYYYYSLSDQKFKKNIREYENGLEKILALRPKSYEMRSSEFEGRLSLPDGEKIGFIAQDVETVLPELVKKAYAPARLTKEEQKNKVKKDPIEYKSVDYTGVIPVLVKAIQEQQEQIEALKAQVQKLGGK